MTGFRAELAAGQGVLVFRGGGVPHSMLGWTLTFLFLAAVAAYLGFFALGGVAASLIKILFVVFAILLAGTSLLGLLRSEPPM